MKRFQVITHVWKQCHGLKNLGRIKTTKLPDKHKWKGILVWMKMRNNGMFNKTTKLLIIICHFEGLVIWLRSLILSIHCNLVDHGQNWTLVRNIPSMSLVQGQVQKSCWQNWMASHIFSRNCSVTCPQCVLRASHMSATQKNKEKEIANQPNLPNSGSDD